MRRDLDNSADIIDSRDVIARIEEIETELRDAHEGEGSKADFDVWLSDMADNDQGTLQEAAQELFALRDLVKEAEGYAGDWLHGATLIRHSYFVEYCQDMLSDLGDLPREIPSYVVIDWEATADNLKVDYTTVDFDGVEYYIR